MSHKYLTTKFGGASFTSGKSEYYPIPQTQIDIQGGDVLISESWILNLN